eukprot:scaffold1900_cov183-Ochromonas_danica.AAC.1
MILTILTSLILLLCSSALYISPSLAPSPAPSVAPSLVPSVYSTPPPEPPHHVYTVAGTANKAIDRGDGQPSQAGLLSQPRGLLTDTNGDIYIIEQHFIRKISFETSVMSTIVGGGSNDTDSGEHGVFYHANETYIPEGWDMAINDKNGNIYFSDGERCCIRVFRPDLGTVLTAIGRCDQCGWYLDDYNSGYTALIHAKANLAFDNSSRTLYFTDTQKLLASVSMFDGIVSVLMNDWSMMTPNVISLGKIWYSKVLEGLVYVDNGNCQLGLLGKSGSSLLAGNPEGLCGVSNVTTLYTLDALFSNISAVTGDDEGNVYFQDMTPQGSIIYQMDPNSDLSRIASASGTLTIGNLYEGSPAIGTILERSNGLAFHSATGSLLLSQSAKGEIWKMALNSSSESAFQSVVGYVNGLSLPATSVMLSAITAMWLDHEGQSLYLAEPDRHRIHVLDTNTQQIRVFAGNGSAGFNGDGEVASFTQLNSPNSIIGDGISHTLFIADSGNCRIRRVSLLDNPVVMTLVGNGMDCGQSSDQLDESFSPTLVTIYPPVALAVDVLSPTLYFSTSENVIYALDLLENRLRVLVSGLLYVPVGLQEPFVNIASLWWDPTGNLVISDAGLNEVFYLDVAAYLLTTIAGNGSAVEGGLLPS